MGAQIDLGNGFSIDFDDAQKFIKALQDQVKRLQATQLNAQHGLRALPPGNDDYSAAWADAGNEMIQKHHDWNQGKQDQLNALIDKVNSVVNQYKQTEHDNTMRA
jgi:hypothetical protein